MAKKICSVENFALIWLDFDGIKKPSEYEPSIRYLQPLVQTIELIFDQIDYITTIEQLQSEQLFVIVVGHTALELIDSLDENEKIDSIYILSLANQTEDAWIDEHDKVRGIYPDIPSIFDALRRDIRRLNTDLVPIVPFNSLEFASPAVTSFVLQHALINDPLAADERQKLIQFCRKHYQKNPPQFQIVQEYATKGYQELSPIQWYTRECFLYQMIQRALRNVDVEILFYLAGFIRDLHHHIEQIYHQTKKLNTMATVFYAQGISKTQLKALKKESDRLLTFNTFVLATLAEDVSLEYARQSHEDSNLLGALFHIHVDRSAQTFPYARLGHLDYFGDSDEHVLFSFNAVFRLISITKREEGIYQIDLVLVREQDEDLLRMSRWMTFNLNPHREFLRLAELLYHNHRLDQAEHLLHLILDGGIQRNPEELAFIHLKLGDIAAEKGQWKEALNHFNIRLILEVSALKEGERHLSSIYGKIAWVEHAQNHLDQALKNFQHALDASPTPSLLGQAIYHEQIGEIYLKNKQRKEAQKSFNRALDLLESSERIEQRMVKRIEERLHQTDQ